MRVLNIGSMPRSVTRRKIPYQVLLNIHKYPFFLIANKMSTHKEYALIAILATIAVVGVVPAFADCPPDCLPKATYNPFTASGPILPISVTTDKSTYDHNSIIMVSSALFFCTWRK